MIPFYFHWAELVLWSMVCIIGGIWFATPSSIPYDQE